MPNGKTELHAQYDLTGNEQFRSLAFTENTDDEHRGNDRDESRNQPAQPWADAKIQETFHHNLPGERASQGRVLSGSKQGHREKGTSHADAQQRAEQLIGVLNFRDLLVPRPMENRGCQYQDRAVDEQSEHKRGARIEGGELDRLAPALRRLLELARLHDGRVQVKIMGHHSRAKNADADVKHFLICDDAWIGNKPQEDASRAGLGKDQFSGKTTSDGGDKSDHNSLDIAKAFCLQIQHQEHIGRSNDATPHQRNSEEKLQPDGRADNLRQIASSDGELAKNPEKQDGRSRVVIATGLG